MYHRVIWEIDIEADSPEEAAKEARSIQLDPESEAVVFRVLYGDEDYYIDLLEEGESDVSL